VQAQAWEMYRKSNMMEKQEQGAAGAAAETIEESQA
jgi:hypothetical protein